MAQILVDNEVQEWLNTISAYERTFKTWEGRVDKILKRYRDENRGYMGNAGSRFNVLWSNVQTITPAVFSRLPKPEVTRRFRDNDPVGRVASMILQRGLEFEVEHYPDYRAAMKNCVQDRFLGGRGMAWVRYEPHFGTPEDGVQITEDADEAQDPDTETVEYECAPVDYVHWREFGHKVARTWEEVTAVWRKVYLGREALVERFGEKLGNQIPLDTSPEDNKKISKADDMDNQALIYEIWDKETNKAIWISKSLGKILDKRDNPLGLENFFPCPRPLFATLTSDSLVPVPDFSLYQDQARELDTLADRIDGLINALKVRGVYDASVPELARLFTEGENNSLLPVKNWSAFSEKQGLRGAIDLVEILPIAQALDYAYKAMDQVKQQIYDITGISDIVRGQTNANETATAQQIKGQYASLRLKSMQNEVSEFAQELIQIKAQIMCKHFSPETLAQIACVGQLSEADQMLIPQAMQMLTQSPLAEFRIEVQADSMVQADEDQDKQDRMEFLTAAGGFIEKAGAAVAQEPKITPLIMDMLKFAITGFKVGRTMEGEFDKVADEMKAQAAQPQPPKPDPEMIKIQSEQQTAQGKLQIEQAKLQQEAQASQQRLQMETQRDQQAIQLKAQTDQMQVEHEAQLAQLKAQHEQFLEGSKLEFQKWQAELEANTKIIVAELSSKTQLQTAALSASQSSDTVDYGVDGTTQPKNSLQSLIEAMNENMGRLMETQQQSHTALIEAMSKPRPPVKIVRDANGKIAGTE